MKSLRTAMLTLLGLAATLTAQSEFDSWTAFEVGTYPQAYYVQSCAVADMDGDGDTDVLTAMGFNTGWITLAKNRGDGSFTQPVATPLSKLCEGVVAADVDNDGDPDVLASLTGSSGNGNTIALLRNLGDGTFAPVVTLPAGGAGPTGLVADDFDGDGWLDVAVAHYGYIGQGETVGLLFNDGTGGFLPVSSVTIPTAPSSSTGPYRLAAGDMDGDELVDLVAACDGDRFVVLFNRGGAFMPGPMVNAFPSLPMNLGIYSDVALADAEHDGDLDVFYSCSNSGWWGQTDVGGIVLMRNDGDGGFAAPAKIPFPTYAGSPSGLEAADITGDGWVDLVGANGSSMGIVYVAGDGAGGFLPGLEFPAGEYPRDLRIADATGDGKPDVLVVNRHSLDVTVHAFGDGPVAGFHVPQPYAVEPLSASMDTADIDADGDLDVATSWEYAGGGGISVLRGLGDGSFATYVHYAGPRAAMDVHFRDLDGDADQDLMWATGNTAPPYDWHYRLNNGQGLFGAAVTVPVHTCGNGGIDAFDMDHDGDQDVFLCDYLGCGGGSQSNVLYVSRNHGDASFDAAYPLTFLLDPAWSDHGDFDADGHPDIIAAQVDKLGVRLGNGDGTFLAPLYSPTVWGPIESYVADLDGDGTLDVATCNMAGDPQQVAAVHIGLGNGTFQAPAKYLVSNSPDYAGTTAIQGGDVDADGYPDLMIANYGSHDVSYLRNKGDGSYEPQVKFGIGETPVDLAYGDFDLDGHGDLAGLVHKQPYALDRGIHVIFGTGANGPAWLVVGSGVPGIAGVPVLNGLGTLDAESSATLVLTHARPLAPVALVVGLRDLSQPFKGGVLVPVPDVILWLGSDAAGAVSLPFEVPSVLSGGDVWMQAWVSDPAAAQGWASSAGLLGCFP